MILTQVPRNSRRSLPDFWKPPHAERGQGTQVSCPAFSQQHHRQHHWAQTPWPYSATAFECTPQHHRRSQCGMPKEKVLGITLPYPWAAVYSSVLLTSHPFHQPGNTKCNSSSLHIVHDFINFRKPFLLLKCQL